MQAPKGSADWEARLNNLRQAMAEAGEIPQEQAANFAGMLTVARMGLTIPGVVEMLRGIMTDLAAIGHKQMTAYMQETIKKFDQEILVGSVCTELLKYATGGYNNDRR